MRLASRDRNESLAVDAADVSCLEPAVHKRVARSLRMIPITLEYRRPAHQYFAVIGNAHFDVRQRLTDSPQFVSSGSVHRDYRGSLRKSVALVDRNTDIGKPLR